MSDLGCGEVVHTWNTDVMMIKCVSLVLVGGRSFWHPASAVIVHRARALTAWLLLPGLNTGIQMKHLIGLLLMFRHFCDYFL